MFEDGARLDDIMNIFKSPTLDKEGDKKETRVSDTGIRYFSKQDISTDNVRLEFTGQQINSGVLK
ncbi:MAG: hypothetical protein IKT98_12260 [Selenomonadaceae bacterium]|nr:hypothetical protein [Selenomonadaceae bacterium]